MSSSPTFPAEEDIIFADLDEQIIYDDIERRGFNEATKSFVVEFVRESAKIAYDLSPESLRRILSRPQSVREPCRWINIWAPHVQSDIIALIATKCGFSTTLETFMTTTPDRPVRFDTQNKDSKKTYQRTGLREDIELAVRNRQESEPTPASTTPSGGPTRPTSHYDVSRQMLHYHLIHFGKHFLCIGANWVHEVFPQSNHAGVLDANLCPSWSWLVLTDDHTVISIHQDPGSFISPRNLSSIRGNTRTVLEQLSSSDRSSRNDTGPGNEWSSSRQAMPSEDVDTPDSPGLEGASSLFFYLFDDWRGSSVILGHLNARLNMLESDIIDTYERRSSRQCLSRFKIGLRLLKFGQQFRNFEQLFRGYDDLIARIVPRDDLGNHDFDRSKVVTNLKTRSPDVKLARTAEARFDRLRNRMDSMIFPQLKNLSEERQALYTGVSEIIFLSDYIFFYNMTAERDADYTAQLASAATLLAKLSVLFLPISLLTSHFSMQIKELEGVYRSRDHWTSFAIVLTLSVLALFLLPKLIAWWQRDWGHLLRLAFARKKSRVVDEDNRL